MSKITLKIPFLPISTNDLWMVVNNRIVLTPKYRAYKYKCADFIRNYKGYKKHKFSGCVFVEITLHNHLGNKSKDIDNYNKSLFDAITASGLWTDDKLVKGFSMVWGENVKGGLTVVTIEGI